MNVRIRWCCGGFPTGCFGVVVLAGLLTSLVARAADNQPTHDYAAVDAIFFKHCLDCHAAEDPDGKLVLESFESLMKGGETEAAIVPGKSVESLLVKMIEGKVEREGKKKIMPPGKRKKLEPEEIATIKAWIDTGAKPPSKAVARPLVVPKITPQVTPRRSINALAYSPEPKLIAVARYGEVELRSAESRALVRSLSGHRGNVNAVVFSADGSQLFAAAGEPGLFGEVRHWKVSDGALVRTLEGHKDALYSIALAPDGKILATGSYDQKIKLWKVETGDEIKTLSGHNGCVFDLAFRPDGKLLASASADRTVKLWDVTTGERRDTLSQSLKELYALAFSPDGKRLAAGGVDNRIRVWQISDTAAETTNPILDAKFAHEGAILNLIFSPDGKTLLSSADDRTIKLWEAGEIKELLVLEKQPDWSPALAFAADRKMIVAGRLDGTLGFYDAATGKPLPPPKPEPTQIEPRGIQRGVTARLKLIGPNLTGLTEVKFQNPKLTAELLRDGSERENEVWMRVTANADLARGDYEFSVANAGGESGKLKLWVDDLPQAYESAANSTTQTVLKLPVSLWGTLDPMGDTDEIEFDAKGGQTVVFDLAARGAGSKANAELTLLDAKGAVLDANNGFDGGDPLFAFKIPATGRYRVRVGETMAAGSNQHFYRLSMGSFPMVIGCYPLSVPAKVESEVELIGFNLPPHAKVHLKAGNATESDSAAVPTPGPARSARSSKVAKTKTIPIMDGGVEVPIDPEKFRARRAFNVLVGDGPESVEAEPNGTPGQAMKIPAPSSVNGRIWPNAKDQQRDVDLFRFETKSGTTWMIETAAARRSSPLDTKIEVLYADGKPVERLLLQAVRDSHITFRGIDSNTVDCRLENWEEMELNQYLYLQGEVVKLLRAPQGPDSGFNFYSSSGKRRAYFDTSATAHANDEPCYIVEPHAPGAKLVANGLPVFTNYYANDDDAERKLGSDSKLLFTAPADGSYLVRVTDTRGAGGERFAYRLTVREAKPDFKVALDGANPTVNSGSGQGFSVSVERLDGFEGEIRVDINGLPPGFTVSTPVIIQAGHNEAKGTINAALDAPQPNETNTAKVTATALVDGQPVTKEVNNFGRIKLGDKPKLFVALEPDVSTTPLSTTSTNAAKPLEITIAPGQTVPAWLKVRRNGHDDLITFTVDNLPHGVIVDNIGLNGVLIPIDQNEREIFLTAARWVPETDRLCFAVENQVGKQTSLPVLLRVRKSLARATAGAR